MIGENLDQLFAEVKEESKGKGIGWREQADVIKLWDAASVTGVTSQEEINRKAHMYGLRVDFRRRNLRELYYSVEVVARYPEHDKLMSAVEKHNVLVEFIQWLSKHDDYDVGKWEGWDFIGSMTENEAGRMLSDYLGIDYDAFARETKQLYGV